ncbi:MAG TPA: type II secretion system protein [Gammaproteobacteria bacterium]|jgi:type II secretory pathway pseudopilin PulG|nr:type II secretion system protein [Gammaproteobacteria bacterium]
MKISGLTLIEILVVFFIISIVASMSLLAISHYDNNAAASFVEEFTQRLSLAEEMALLNAVTIPFKLQTVPKGLAVHFQNRLDEQIIISANGDATPFHLYVGKNGERPRYVVISEGDGAIETKKLP